MGYKYFLGLIFTEKKTEENEEEKYTVMENQVCAAIRPAKSFDHVKSITPKY